MTSHRDLAKDLPDPVRAATGREADRLLKMLRTQPEYAEIRAAREAFLPAAGPHGDDEKLSLYGELGSNPLASLLVVAGASDASDRLDRLTALVFGATLLFVARTSRADDEYRPKRALCTMRGLLARKSFRRLASRIPDVSGFNRRDAAHALARLSEELRLEAGDLKKRGMCHHLRIDEITRLLKNVGAPVVRGSHQSPVKDRDDIMDAGDGPQHRPFSDDPDVRLRTRHESVRHVPGVEDAEDAADFRADECGLVDSGIDHNPLPQATFFSLGLEAQAHVDMAARPATTSICISASLTLDEARRICSSVLAEAGAGAVSSGALLCALSLLLGQEIDALLCASRDDGVAGRPFWIRSDGRIALAQAVGARARGVYAVFIPEGLQGALGRLLASPPTPEEAGKLAGEWLRKTIGDHRPARLSRLSRFLADALKGTDVDPAVVALLSFFTVNDYPGLYYASPAVADLNKATRRFRERVLCFGPEVRALVVSPRGETHVGSLRAPSEVAVQAYFAQLCAQVESARFRVPTAAAIARLHGAYVNYIGALLNFLTARRPHAAAFETLDQTGGRASPYLLLSDKENRAVSAARLVPLPDIAVAQIAAYRRHLERVAAWFHLEAPEIAAAARAALDGTGPSLFVIGLTGPKLHIWASFGTISEPLDA